MEHDEMRPDPDFILKNIRSKEKGERGKLKIFLGYAAGVGKTYAMLDDAKEQLKSGVDVVVGYIEPHSRPETMQLLEGLNAIPPVILHYKNMTLKEFDLAAALQRKPELILVDELAHSNAEGVRHKKRYQDVEELLNAGIDVYTTINIQHIESLNDIIEDITTINVRETVPDYIFDNADKVKLVDVDPDELLKRFEEGKIYRPERATVAMQNFFTKDNLRLLREIAMRKTADGISQYKNNENTINEKTIGTKFLVCIGPSVSSAKCIRWTARIADAFHCQWIALYVETPNSASYSDEQNRSIRNNLDLAARLGAPIVTLNGIDIASVISQYSKLSGITDIVIGKSRNRKALQTLFEKDLEDKLISLLSNTEIHIITDNDDVKPFRNPEMFKWRNNIYFTWHDTFKTTAILIITIMLSLLVREAGIGNQNIIMIFILSVLIISRFTQGYLFGVTSSILSVLIFNFLFVEPLYTFNAIQSGYPLTFLIMLLVALFTSALMIRIKTQVALTVSRERRTEILYEINKKLLVTRGLDNIIELTNTYISNYFGRSSIFYFEDPDGGNAGVFKQSSLDPDSSYMLTRDEQAVAHWVFVNKKRAGAGTDTLMGAGAFYMPILSQGNVLGVLGISCINGVLIDHNNRIFLRMIASLVAMALERQRLSDEQRNIVIESEKEKMRSNLLRAISHDLRTPLTGILGSSSAILENKNTMDTVTQVKLLEGIKEDSQWLIRMVENLLSITRISESTMNVVKIPEAVEEIVAESVSRIKNRFNNSNIIVKVPDDLLMIPMDGTLIEQVIINLLENAIKHSPENSPIHLTVKKSDNIAIFEVSDNGEGISQQDLPSLFDGYSSSKSKSSDSSRGMGIGLTICKSIINAHNGKIEAENKTDGGAIFRFMLPIIEEKENLK